MKAALDDGGDALYAASTSGAKDWTDRFDFSAISVAAHLGVSRQKVYELSRASPSNSYIDQVPWRHP